MWIFLECYFSSGSVPRGPVLLCEGFFIMVLRLDFVTYSFSYGMVCSPPTFYGFPNYENRLDATLWRSYRTLTCVWQAWHQDKFSFINRTCYFSNSRSTLRWFESCCKAILNSFYVWLYKLENWTIVRVITQIRLHFLEVNCVSPHCEL